MIPSDLDPIGVFLVSSGTRGDRLLFRYPFELHVATKSLPDSDNPRALKEVDKAEDFDVNRIALKDQKIIPVSGPLAGYPDVVLATLLCIRANLCRRRCEIKVNDMVFVGYPMQMPAAAGAASSTHTSPGTCGSQPPVVQPSPKREQSSTVSYNIVFAVKAGVGEFVISAYQELAKQISVALMHEERRCGYFTKQKLRMWALQDDISTSPEENSVAVAAFRVILQRCSLAKLLRQIFTDCTSCTVWVPVSFILLPKAHLSVVPGIGPPTVVKPETIQKCVDALRPYHTLLLLEDEHSLLSSLPIDASPSLVRLVKVANPLKNLHSLSLDADLAVEQVLQLVAHLVYWAKASIIYPLCESNVYLLSPRCDTSSKSSLAERFSAEFSNLNLIEVLAEFSLPSSLREHLDSLSGRCQQAVTLPMIIWLLRNRFLYQVHSYVTLLPPADMSTSTTIDSMTHSDVSLVDSSVDGSPLSAYIVAASSVAASPPSVLRSDADTSVNNVVASESRRVSLDAKDHAVSKTSHQEAPHAAAAAGHIPWRRHSTLQLLSHLSPAELRVVYSVPAASNADDLKLFARLCRYFDGRHHLEEMMFYENIRRSQLLIILEKFYEILVVSHHEEPNISYWLYS